MRRIALPIAICLFASYGCASSDDSDPAGGKPSTGGALGTGGTPGAGGTALPIAGTTTTGTAGVTGTGGSLSGTAGATTGTAGATTGTAGATGTGGSGPAAATCMTTVVATGTPTLIDAFETGMVTGDGRTGGWYFSTDTTGMTTPKPGAPVAETGGMPGKALHVSGTGLTGWGASLSVSIAPLNGCYDATKFKGLTVMLKGTGSVWVSVLTAAVRGAPEGMRNHYKKQVTLGADWTAVPIAFSDLTQPGGWGVQVPFDVTKIYGVDFGPAAATAPATTDFDFWVDELSFTP